MFDRTRLSAGSSRAADPPRAASRDPLAETRVARERGDPTVKAHELLAPEELGLTRYANPPGEAPRHVVRVRPETLKHLKAAQLAHQVVQSTFVAGAGNQVLDVLASGGESWARRKIGTAAAPESSLQDHLTRVQVAQGGHCTEQAAMTLATLAQMDITAPIVRIYEDSPRVDHAYTIIGDPRDPRWGEQTVVVDPWVCVPSASTLAQTAPVDARTGLTWSLHPLTSTGFPVDVIRPMDTDEVNRRLPGTPAMRGVGAAPVGEALVSHIGTLHKMRLFDVRTGTDPSTLYTDGTETVSMDDVPQETVDRLRQGAAEMARLRSERKPW
jgi:hypothetical protein